MTREKCLVRLSAVLMLLCAPGASSEDPARPDYIGLLFLEIGFVTESAAAAQRRLLSLINAGELGEALQLTTDLQRSIREDLSESAMRLGKVVLNEALLAAETGDRERAFTAFEAGIGLISDSHGRFHPDLAEAYTARALLHLGRDNPASIADLRRAQHIMHRYDGVFSADQVLPLRYLAVAHGANQQRYRADTDYRFMVKVSEVNHGADSLAHLPILVEAASYFSRRGADIPAIPPHWRMPPGPEESLDHDAYRRESIFREAHDLYEHAIGIVEQNHGADDLRIVPLLQGLAQLRVRQGIGLGSAEHALERALRIVRESPSTDPADLADAYIRLGDMYTVTSDRRAAESYLLAWDTLSGDTELEALRRQLFAHPTRLEVGLPPPASPDRMPDHAGPGDPLFVEVSYTVRADGRVEDVRVADSNLPFRWRSYVRTRMEATRYRPRVDEREPVATRGLSYRHHFTLRLPRSQRQPPSPAG